MLTLVINSVKILELKGYYMALEKIRINLDKLKTYPISKRKCKVKYQDFAKPPLKGVSFSDFYNSIPNILIGQDFKSLVDAIVLACNKKKPVIFMMGAHVIKCGLNPVIIELMKKKVITAISLNGAGAIHDFEIALIGKTSEDVGTSLEDGSFGMAKETALYINGAFTEAVEKDIGAGEAIASVMNDEKLHFREHSILYNALKEDVTSTVHIAIGTDIIHQHPSFDAGSAGEASLKDFHNLIEEIAMLGDGGVVFNIGSSVLLPEVFLKALNVARNLGYQVKDFTAANFDMIQHYRPHENVVSRPVKSGGKGYTITGHHEIMLPLLAQAVIEKI
jgi:deoxyhypusine synthase